MARKEAPATLTGGAGFNYEDCVAARFLIDLLAGTNALGVGFGRIARIDWQARDAGWLLDDIAVTCAADGGERAAGLSCKRHRQVTESGFPANFVEGAWEQWLGHRTKRAFRQGRDTVVLVTGQLANAVSAAWSKTLSEALHTTAERMLERLAPPASAAEGAQSCQLQRDLYASLRCPPALRAHPGTDDKGTIRLLSHIRLLHFDFHSEPSQDEVAAVVDCQTLLRSGDTARGADLWAALLRIAADNRAQGGSIDSPGLLTALRSRFDLRDHPDFRADWDIATRRSCESLEDVRCDIGGLPPLPRVADLQAIHERLASRRICLLVGESGCGKSALVRWTAEQRYGRFLWFPSDLLDSGGLLDVERALGLHNPLPAVLRASPTPCLLVFDGLEGHSDRALRNAARLMKDLQDDASAAHVHVLLTTQIEGMRRIIERLVEQGVTRARLEALPITRPAEREIKELVAGAPRFSWAALRPELRPVLRNLKVLDWVVRAVQAGPPVGGEEITGLTTLIERIWERWVGDDGGPARSGLLQRLAALEAETLVSGVPLPRLEHVEQLTLRSLATADLVRVRSERVLFAHDLLGDWARLRVLIGEEPVGAEMLRSRAALPRWHRAVRLFGQNLLEQGGEGLNRWERLLELLDDGSYEGIVTRDLLLEAVVLADHAVGLLRRVWPVLIAQKGRLLQRLLDRFLYVATIPDPRIADIVSDPKVAGRLEHRLRLPFRPYWGAVITVLHERNSDVVRLVPGVASRICTLWLRSVPLQRAPGEPYPWRHDAAQLAFAIACEIQRQKAAGKHHADDLAADAYEAALYGALDLPDEIGSLALQLACRRDESPDVRNRREQARREAEEARHRLREERQQARKIAQPCAPLFPRGPLRGPWPDGPRSRVHDAFRKACLDTPALTPLMRARPAVALEVLLAVCIEEPQHEEPFACSVWDEVGVTHWQTGYPPLYSRGPFLHFLREAPEQGLSFVLRLVNFATRRWTATAPRKLERAGLLAGNEGGISVRVGDQVKQWLGNDRVLPWSLGWSIDSQVVSCALMALEKWLDEKADAGESVDEWMRCILQGSESVAFLGVLLSLGKKQPSLFEGVLRPLLGAWELYYWDQQTTAQQTGTSPALMAWAMQQRAETAAAREWHTLPHRSRTLLELAVDMLLFRPNMAELFLALGTTWRPLLNAQGQPERLLLLIERLNRSNYTEFQDAHGQLRFRFEWPEAIRERNERDVRRANADLMLITFPWQCRRSLDAGSPLTAEELPQFWDALQSVSLAGPIEATEAGPAPVRVEDAECGGIAVLIILHGDWLKADQKKNLWCRRRLEEIASNPPPALMLDVVDTIGSDGWNVFLAECGVHLLAENHNDELARKLVAFGLASFHDGSAAVAMKSGFALRDRLGNEFKRMQTLALYWAVIRQLRVRAENLQFEHDLWRDRHLQLLAAFIEGTLPTEVPSLATLSSEGVELLDDLDARRFPERARGNSNRPHGETGDGREELRRHAAGLDLKVVENALLWLSPQDAASTNYECRWRERIRDCLSISLGRLPVIVDTARQAIEGLPDDYDRWVFRLVTRAILRSSSPDERRAFWQPILDLAVPAHDWIEHFFWEWFIVGVEATEAPAMFARAWGEMIEYALAHPGWGLEASRTYDLDDMVFELLGLHWGAQTVGENLAFREALGQLSEVFERASQRWFGMGKVASGFARFLAGPATDHLLCRGARNLHEALRSSDASQWRERDLEGNLIAALRACWDRQQDVVIADRVTREAFLGLLTMLASRGSHAAIALRDQVLRCS